MYEWIKTVKSTTMLAIAKEITNIHKLILVLNAKLFNHFVIKCIVTGTESKAANNTRIKLFNMKE